MEKPTCRGERFEYFWTEVDQVPLKWYTPTTHSHEVKCSWLPSWCVNWFSGWDYFN